MTLAPRVVVVHRTTEREEITRQAGTWGQAQFQQKVRGVSLDTVKKRSARTDDALQTVSAAIPGGWRRGSVERSDLDRFLFEPQDVVVVVGVDGLVANTAKYLSGQPVIGVNTDPGAAMGVLVRHTPDRCAALLAAVEAGRAQVEQRTMVSASAGDGDGTEDGGADAGSGAGSGFGSVMSKARKSGSGDGNSSDDDSAAPALAQHLSALNEVYIGHAGHQSARYRIVLADGRAEPQSSSGLLVGTGTGATGWLSSVARNRTARVSLPEPVDPTLAWFVREAWPSPATGTELTEGLLESGATLRVLVQSESLTVFGDGIEADHLTATWGQTIAVRAAAQRLHLVV